MEIPGAKEIAVEIHSFSKTFNMTGWRIGFVVGSKALIDAVSHSKIKFRFRSVYGDTESSRKGFVPS